MKKIFFVIFIIIFLSGCQNKKNDIRKDIFENKIGDIEVGKTLYGDFSNKNGKGISEINLLGNINNLYTNISRNMILNIGVYRKPSDKTMEHGKYEEKEIYFVEVSTTENSLENYPVISDLYFYANQGIYLGIKDDVIKSKYFNKYSIRKFENNLIYYYSKVIITNEILAEWTLFFNKKTRKLESFHCSYGN